MEKVTSQIGQSKWVVLSRWILPIQEFQGKFFYDEDEKRYSRTKLEVEGWNTPSYTDIVKLYCKIILKLRIRKWNGVFIHCNLWLMEAGMVELYTVLEKICYAQTFQKDGNLCVYLAQMI